MKANSEAIFKFLNRDFQKCNILVVGDMMLDQYWYGDAERISPEAPVLINLIQRRENRLGGSANVVHNLAKMGCKVFVAGQVGNDEYGKILIKMMKNLGADLKGIILSQSPTTTKIRVLAGQQQVIRLDFEEKDTISIDYEKQIVNYVKKQIAKGLSGIIISDYGKGICSEGLCQKIISMAKEKRVLTFVDPKGKYWEKYHSADFITPNVKEIGDVINRKLPNNRDSLIPVAKKIMSRLDIKNIMITRSNKGVTLVSDTGDITIPTEAKEVYDVSGAGDTVLAAFSLGISSNLSLEEAAYIANLAAGIGVEKIGTYAVGLDEILERLNYNEKLLNH